MPYLTDSDSDGRYDFLFHCTAQMKIWDNGESLETRQRLFQIRTDRVY